MDAALKALFDRFDDLKIQYSLGQITRTTFIKLMDEMTRDYSDRPTNRKEHDNETS